MEGDRTGGWGDSMKRIWIYRVVALIAGPALLALQIIYWPLHIGTNVPLTWVSIVLLVVTAVSVAGIIAEWSEQQRLRREGSQEGGQDDLLRSSA